MGDIKVQRAVTDFGASADVATPSITAVGSLASAFARLTNVQFSGGGVAAGSTVNKNNRDLGATCRLTATNTLTLTRDATGEDVDHKFAWEIWEYTGSGGGANEFIVRYSGEVSIPNGTATVDQAVSGISSLSKCVPFICGVSHVDSQQQWHRAKVSAQMVDASGNKVRLSRGDTTGDLTVSVAVVEFTGSAWTVWNNIAHTVASGGSVETETISDVGNWANCFIVYSSGGHDHSNNDEISTACWRGATTTALKFIENGGSGEVFYAHVVKHANLDVEHLNSIDGGGTDIPSGSSSPQTHNVTVTTLSSTAEAGLIGGISTGEGFTQYARPHVNYRLTSVSNVEFWRSRHGQAAEYTIQVIDFSGVSGGGAEPKSGSDSGALSGSEGTPGLASSSTRAESGGLSASEALLLLSQSSRSDSGSVGVSDISEILALRDIADSGVLSVEESSAPSVLLARSDSGALSVVETAGEILSLLSRADSGILSIVESRVLESFLSVVDGGVLSGLDEVVLGSFVSAIDSGILAGTESLVIAALLSAIDSGVISGDEVALLQSFLERADSGALSATESFGVSSFSDRTDSGLVSSDETAALSAILEAIDSGLIIVAEGSEVSASGAADKDVVDSGALSSVEAESTSVILTRLDDGSIAAVDSVGILSALDRSDSGLLSALELFEILSSLGMTESGALLGLESSSLANLLSRSDSGLILSSESSSLGAFLLATDSGTFVAVESVIDLLARLSPSDLGQLISTDLTLLLGSSEVSESSVLGSVESAAALANLLGSDSGVLAVVEGLPVIVGQGVVISTFAIPPLSVQILTESSRVEVSRDVHLSREQMLNEGPSRVIIF